MKRRSTSAQRKSNLEKLKKLRIGEESHIEINMSTKMTQQDLDKRRKSNLEKLKKLRIVDESHSERPMQRIIDSPNHPQTKQRLPITWYECKYCDGLRTKDEEYMYTHWRIHEWLFNMISFSISTQNFYGKKNMTSVTTPHQNFY